MFGQTMPCFPCSSNGLYMLYFLRCFPKEMAVTKIIDSLENLCVVQGFLEVVKPYTGSVPFVLQTFFRKSSKKFGTYSLPAEVVPVCTKLPFCQIHCTNHKSFVKSLLFIILYQFETRNIVLIKVDLWGSWHQDSGSPLHGIASSVSSSAQTSPCTGPAALLRKRCHWDQHPGCVWVRVSVCPRVYVRYYCFTQEQRRYIIQCSSIKQNSFWLKSK